MNAMWRYGESSSFTIVSTVMGCLQNVSCKSLFSGSLYLVASFRARPVVVSLFHFYFSIVLCQVSQRPDVRSTHCVSHIRHISVCQIVDQTCFIDNYLCRTSLCVVMPGMGSSIHYHYSNVTQRMILCRTRNSSEF